jgi:hypothetical protein
MGVTDFLLPAPSAARKHELSSTSMQFSLDEDPGLEQGGDGTYTGESLAKMQSRPSELQRTDGATVRHGSGSRIRDSCTFFHNTP